MAEHPSMTFITLAIMFFLSAKGINQAAGANKTNDIVKGDTSEDLVVETCKYIEDKKILFDKLHFDVKTCISVLHSDNRSTTAKNHGDLVVIALDTLSRRTSEVAAKVSQVTHGYTLRNEADLYIEYCVADYAAVATTLPVCHDIFQDLKPWGNKTEYHDAVLALDCMDRLWNAVVDCYVYAGLSSMFEEFENVFRHASLTWGLMEIALNYFDDYS